MQILSTSFKQKLIKALGTKPKLKTTHYQCPNCDFTLITAIPNKGKTFEGDIICKSCCVTFYKSVNDKGEVILS